MENNVSVGLQEKAKEMWQQAILSVECEYEKQPEVLFVGDVCIGTLGNFSASVGKAKAKKTFNVSAYVAAALSNNVVLKYRANLPEGKRRVLYVDTEQSRYHCHHVLERILEMSGLPTDMESKNLDFVCLREYTPETRMELIEYALQNNKGYGLVIIDGLRDLLLDINNAAESVGVINKLMEWSSKYNLHIHGVLHLNKGDNNVRGHIGTEMNNKAEAILLINKSTANPNVSEVRPLHIREKEFKPFAFKVSEDGLPVLATDYDHEAEQEQKGRITFQSLSAEQHHEALALAFHEHPIKGYQKTLDALSAAYEQIGFKRGRNVMVEGLKCLVNDLKLVNKKDKLYFYGMSPEEASFFEADDD